MALDLFFQTQKLIMSALGFSGQIFASFVASEKHIIPQLLNPPSLFVCPSDIVILVL